LHRTEPAGLVLFPTPDGWRLVLEGRAWTLK
jgi:hypothetical protein